jgi:aldose 1-epimerase
LFTDNADPLQSTRFGFAGVDPARMMERRARSPASRERKASDVGSVDGFETVIISSAGGRTEAEFVPDANMLCCSLRHRGAELLDAGHGVRAYAERGKTMGIPLLYPWANRLAAREYRAGGKLVGLPAAEGRYAVDPNGLPIHGALPGLLRWQLDPVPSGPPADRIGARLDWSSPELLELFPFVHELDLDVHVTDAGIELVTTVRATGEDSVPVAFGFHPYLTIPGTRRQTWEVTLGARSRLILDERMLPTGEREPIDRRTFGLGDQSWDDGLADLTEPPEFEVSAGGVRLAMSFGSGFSYAQVYAPPGHEFICFEPMTAPSNALISGDGLALVGSGGQYRAAFSISVSR